MHAGTPHNSRQRKIPLDEKKKEENNEEFAQVCQILPQKKELKQRSSSER